jgi:GAF domain-containing protein
MIADNRPAPESTPGLQADRPPLAAALAELVGLLLTTSDLDDFLSQLARLGAQVVSPPASCGITLRRDRQPMPMAASDAMASHVDEVQYGQDEGPCLQTLRTGLPVEVPDLTVETRWGSYPSHALAYGVRSSLSLPLTADGITIGALNLYSSTSHVLVNGERAHAEAFVAQASAALSLLLRQARQAKLTDQLREALTSRSVIDQALGIIMGQQRCDAEQAFATLRTASQHQHRKLAAVADEIVTAVGGQPSRPTPFHDPA